VTMTPVRIAEAAPGVGSLQIATDEQPYFEENALASLRSAVRLIAGDAGLRAVLVEGGTRQFCGGAPASVLLAPDADKRVERLMSEAGQLLLDIEPPTIAVMSGHALGGGLMLGLWCDIAFLAEESLYGANFLDLGFTPGMGATSLAEEIFGAPLGRELLLTARLVKGREIQESGAPIKHAVVPRAQVRTVALRRATEIAALPKDAVVLLKRHLAARRGNRLHEALGYEIAMHRKVLREPATRQRIAAHHLGQENPRAD
jgi:4-carboxy-3-alkylbut-2-enoyl-[acp] decarboxylase